MDQPSRSHRYCLVEEANRRAHRSLSGSASLGDAYRNAEPPLGSRHLTPERTIAKDANHFYSPDYLEYVRSPETGCLTPFCVVVFKGDAVPYELLFSLDGIICNLHSPDCAYQICISQFMPVVTAEGCESPNDSLSLERAVHPGRCRDPQILRRAREELIDLLPGGQLHRSAGWRGRPRHSLLSQLSTRQTTQRRRSVQ